MKLIPPGGSFMIVTWGVRSPKKVDVVPGTSIISSIPVSKFWTESMENFSECRARCRFILPLMSELSDSQIYLTNPIWLDPEVSPDVSWRCTSQVPLVVEGETSHPCSCGLLTKVVAIQASFRHSNTCWGMSLGIGWLSSKLCAWRFLLFACGVCSTLSGLLL